MKLTYHVLNKNVNKIDFVSPSADCSVVLWWGSLEGAIKMMIGTKTDFNTGSISMYEIVIKFYISNDSFNFKYNLSFVIYDIVQYSVAS
jgi:hypothetical protein